jgi:hypothetical protein
MPYSTRKRKQRQRRHRKKSLRYKKGGGCGSCDNAKSWFGGSNNLGPSPGLEQLPIRSYYELNSYQNDPNSPSTVQSTRIQPNMIGGRKRGSKSRRHRRRKSTKQRRMRGGGFLDGYSLLGSDAISNFGNSSGAFNASDLLHGNVGVNPNPSVQPITTMFNSNNPQLV